MSLIMTEILLAAFSPYHIHLEMGHNTSELPINNL